MADQEYTVVRELQVGVSPLPTAETIRANLLSTYAVLNDYLDEGGSVTVVPVFAKRDQNSGFNRWHFRVTVDDPNDPPPPPPPPEETSLAGGDTYAYVGPDTVGIYTAGDELIGGSPPISS